MDSPCDGCTGLNDAPEYKQCFGCSRAWNSGLAKAVRGPAELKDKYRSEEDALHELEDDMSTEMLARVTDNNKDAHE